MISAQSCLEKKNSMLSADEKAVVEKRSKVDKKRPHCKSR